MKKISFLFAAMMFAALGTGIAPVTAGVAHADEAADKAAELAKKSVVRKEMVRPLTEVQELLEKNSTKKLRIK
jgi:non-ribosomal peptide synthetase component E (peptide arylation enzyme)